MQTSNEDNLIENESNLIEGALQILRERLPSGWTVGRTAGPGVVDKESDALFSFSPQAGMSGGVALIEARRNFAAADVDRLLGGLTRRLRETSTGWPIVLVSDFLSPRTRDLLAREDIGYVDLTGNVRLVMRNPGMFIETSGNDHRPSGTGAKRAAGLAGVKAGQIIRFLVEVVPPYGVLDIEQATRISRGYVSRVLERLADEALIEREKRGPVMRADWPALLRRRGQSVGLFGASTVRTYVSPSGSKSAFEALRQSRFRDNIVVTGSFAAVRVAPVAAPTLLVLYLDGLTFDPVVESLGLWPADESPDVVLLRPSNMSVLDNPRPVDGLQMVGLPQLVIDCLGGVGRMPSEGEAVLDWMQTNETVWRYPSLDEYLRARR